VEEADEEVIRPTRVGRAWEHGSIGAGEREWKWGNRRFDLAT